MIQLTQLRMLRDRREQRARVEAEECRRAELKPRAAMNEKRIALDEQNVVRNRAAERLTLHGDVPTSISDQLGGRADLVRIDVLVRQKKETLIVAERALEIAVNATNAAESKLKIARTKSEKSERSLERQRLFVRQEGLSVEEALLDEQIDTKALTRRDSVRPEY